MRSDAGPWPGRWRSQRQAACIRSGRPTAANCFIRGSLTPHHGHHYTTTGGSFLSNTVRVWSDGQTRTVGTYVSFGLAPDGKRFAVFPMPESTAEDKGAAHVTFLLNFSDEVRRRVPVGK